LSGVPASGGLQFGYPLPHELRSHGLRPRRRTADARAAFLAWDEARQNGGEDDPPSDNPDTLAPPLRAWFLEMVKTYPPLNNFYLKTAEVDDPNGTDYSLSRVAIYACFAWSLADAARGDVMRLAAKHAVGVFEVSAESGAVWRPNQRGLLERLKD
jgi:hypothetical protein